MNFKKLSRGETFIEVIMALFVISLGAATATTLIVNSLRSNIFSRDTLVALNLAVEGVEGIRDIRDTNWLRFGYDKKNCWNMMPDTVQGTDCQDVTHLIQEGNYTIGLQPLTFGWSLHKSANDTDILNLGDGITSMDYQYRLILTDIDKTMDSNINGKLDDDPDIYTDSTSADLAVGVEKSKFFRMIRIIYTDPADEANSMLVQSVVQWVGSGTVHQITLSSILTNY